METSLGHKFALITGGSAGLGKAMAITFAAAGTGQVFAYGGDVATVCNQN